MIMSDISTDTSTPAGGDKPKRSHKRLWITLGAVGVVLVSLAAGGLVWHQSPSFCNAACHTPMDAYVQGYDSGDTAILVTAHAEGPQGLSCLDCHEPTLGQQFSKLIEVSVVLCLLIYVYSSVALWRLARKG